jgi:hypothetical protein
VSAELGGGTGADLHSATPSLPCNGGRPIVCMRLTYCMHAWCCTRQEAPRACDERGSKGAERGSIRGRRQAHHHHHRRTAIRGRCQACRGACASEGGEGGGCTASRRWHACSTAPPLAHDATGQASRAQHALACVQEAPPPPKKVSGWKTLFTEDKKVVGAVVTSDQAKPREEAAKPSSAAAVPAPADGGSKKAGDRGAAAEAGEAPSGGASSDAATHAAPSSDKAAPAASAEPAGEGVAAAPEVVEVRI